MHPGVTQAEIDHVVEEIRHVGLDPHVLTGVERTVINIIGDDRLIRKDHLSLLPGVEEVIPILKPYKLASRDFKHENTVVDVAGVPIGGKQIPVIAGPCSVEGEEQVMLKVTVAEVQRQLLKQFGINLGATINAGNFSTAILTENALPLTAAAVLIFFCSSFILLRMCSQFLSKLKLI